MKPANWRIVRGLICCVVAVALSLGGCVTTAEKKATSAERRVAYRVRSGDTLEGIAWRFGLRTNEVAYWNRMWLPPYKLHPGQLVFLSPPAGGTPRPPWWVRWKLRQRPASRPAPPAPARPARSTAASIPQPRPVAPPRPVEPRPVNIPKPAPPRPVSSPAIDWQWPILPQRGIKPFATQSAGGLGLRLRGRPGELVRAAASGKVVYSGNNLKGYGELIIIKHSDTLVSAYGFNRKRFVSEGMWVRKGQKIAEMGVQPNGDTVLYFDIRRLGRSVDPLRYLPAL